MEHPPPGAYFFLPMLSAGLPTGGNARRRQSINENAAAAKMQAAFRGQKSRADTAALAAAAGADEGDDEDEAFDFGGAGGGDECLAPGGDDAAAADVGGGDEDEDFDFGGAGGGDECLAPGGEGDAAAAVTPAAGKPASVRAMARADLDAIGRDWAGEADADGEDPAAVTPEAAAARAAKFLGALATDLGGGDADGDAEATAASPVKNLSAAAVRGEAADALAALYGRHLKEFGAKAAADIDDAPTETSGDDTTADAGDGDEFGGDDPFAAAAGGGDEAAPPGAEDDVGGDADGAGDNTTDVVAEAPPSPSRPAGFGGAGVWEGEPEAAGDIENMKHEDRASRQLKCLGNVLSARVIDGGGEPPASPSKASNKSAAAAALKSLAASPALSPARRRKPEGASATGADAAAPRFCGSSLAPSSAGAGADGAWKKTDLVKTGWRGGKKAAQKAAKKQIAQLLAPEGRATRAVLAARAEKMARDRCAEDDHGSGGSRGAEEVGGDDEDFDFSGGGGDEAAPPGGGDEAAPPGGDDGAAAAVAGDGDKVSTAHYDPVWAGASPEDRFRAAAAVVDGGRCKKGVSAAQTLELYGLRQQAEHGNNKDEKPKGMFKRQSRKKWDAWTACKDTSEEDAQGAFANLVRTLANAAFNEELLAAAEKTAGAVAEGNDAGDGNAGEDKGSEEEKGDELQAVGKAEKETHPNAVADANAEDGDAGKQTGGAEEEEENADALLNGGGGGGDEAAPPAGAEPANPVAPKPEGPVVAEKGQPLRPASIGEALGWCVKMQFDVEAESGDEESGVVGTQTFGGRIIEVDKAAKTVSCQTRSDSQVEKVEFVSTRIIWVRSGAPGDGWSEESSSESESEEESDDE